MEPSSSPSSVVRSNSQAAASPATIAVAMVPRTASAALGTSTGRISSKPGREPALEQDQRERDDADDAGVLGVVEVDQAEAVGAQQHPEAEEQDEARDADAAGQQRGAQRRGEQRASREDGLAFVHPGRLWRGQVPAAEKCW